MTHTPETINFNDRVTLTLNSLGRAVFDGYHERLLRGSGIAPPVAPPDGRVDMSLWECANIFGKHLYNGCDVPFNVNAELHRMASTPPPPPAPARDEGREVMRAALTSWDADNPERTFAVNLRHLACIMSNKALLAHMAKKNSASAAQWAKMLAAKADEIDAALAPATPGEKPC